MRAKEAACLTILAAVFLFYLFTIRSGQPWPDDFAMYIHEAKNLVDHTPLIQTGYIYDPYNPALGPRLYPPIWPLFLTPAYLIGGLQNFLPMQIEVVLFFIATLVVLWRGLGQDLPPAQQAIMLVIIGFNPVLWDAKDRIGSDVPFTFFLYLALFFAEDLRKSQLSRRARLCAILLVASLVYLCYGTRTVGFVLIPAFLIWGAMNWKQSGGKSLLGAGFVSMVPCWAQSQFFAGDGYADQLRFGLLAYLRTFERNLKIYTWSLGVFWQSPYSKLMRDVISVGLVSFAIVAYFHRLRNGPRTYEIVAALYVIVILAFPYDGGTRYLIPILPLFVYYALDGMRLSCSRLAVTRPGPVWVTLLVLILLVYGSQFSRSELGPFRDGIDKPESKELFAFIATHTDPNDVLVFRRPRALALFTGRSAAVYPSPENDQQYARYLETIHVNYVIEAPSLDDPPFDEFVASDCLPKQLVFGNADFKVFRVTLGDLEACAGSGTQPHSLSLRAP